MSISQDHHLWEHILSTINFDPITPITYITSKQIKEAKSSWKGKQNQFEPRLLCKMDTSQSRPSIFKFHNLFLLSVRNGTYILFKHDIYIKLPCYQSPALKIINISKSSILTLGNSESSMLDILKYNYILDHIIGESVIYGPLLSGRHRCSFNTTIGLDTISVIGSQYETDGCYETENFVCIVEAKTIPCDNFNIRQLYFPFQAIHQHIKNNKQIIALFIYKNDDIIHIYKFKWGNPDLILDIHCIDYYRYTI